jgi:hypothetical protein
MLASRVSASSQIIDQSRHKKVDNSPFWHKFVGASAKPQISQEPALGITKVFTQFSTIDPALSIMCYLKL